jgi:hypothetical protein
VFKDLSLRNKLLLALWTFFLLLVAFKIHGSSIVRTAISWRPEGRAAGSSDYLLEPLVEFARDKIGSRKFDLRQLPELYGQPVRSDEYKVSTPYALSQCAHQPPFPVVNTNIGLGQNMLLFHSAPVWHIAALSRPSTWGYLIFGAERGLAWQWWFQPFSCFTALLLLFEILLRGHLKLSIFGAFWCTGSAYMVCWSNLPSYATFFPAAACVAGYHLLSSASAKVQTVSAILLGLLVPGFVMFLYPPWQVCLGYLFLAIFVVLLFRERLFRNVLERRRLVLAVLAFVIASGLLCSYLITCMPAITILSNTVFPGRRLSSGGGVAFWQLLKGWYNFWTIRQEYDFDGNVCESASFYHFYPAIVIGAIFSKQIRNKLGALGWALLGFIGVMLWFALHGFPNWLATLTCMNFALPSRVDLAVGIASIIASIMILADDAEPLATQPRNGRLASYLAGVGTFLIFLLAGALTVQASKFAILPYIALGVSLGGTYLSYVLIAGKADVFCGAVAMLVVATAALFNPLGRGLDVVYNSEMALKIQEINAAAPDHPLWLCYGDDHPGVLVSLLGGRSLAGVHQYPQLELWHELDPERKHEDIYNRYAHVFLVYNPDKEKIEFETRSPVSDLLLVKVSPLNPILKKLGARYVLVHGNAMKDFDETSLKLLAKGGAFAIYEIP